jgi:hypothetical protein
MTALKTLAITAALAATIIPANAAYLGDVDFTNLKPVACRNLDDAIEASKFNDFGTKYLPKKEFVKRHQASSTFTTISGIPVRVPGKGDCVIASRDDGDDAFDLSVAVQIKATLPNLPSGMIAICATTLVGAIKPQDCNGGAEAVPGYWIVIKPGDFLRNFDLPKE